MRSNKLHKVLLVSVFSFIDPYLQGQESSGPASPTNLSASDHPWAHGEKIDIQWDDIEKNEQDKVQSYSIYSSRSANPDSFIFVGTIDADISKYTIEKLDRKYSYYFKIIAIDKSGNVS